MNRLSDSRDKDVLVMSLEKPGQHGRERYVFMYRDTAADRSEVLRVFGRFAANSEIGFSWYDAAVLSRRIREQQRLLDGGQRSLDGVPPDV